MRFRTLLTGMAAASAIALAAQPAQARTLDPANPEDALQIQKRVQCGVSDGEPAVYYWSGKVYSRVAGEPDRHLFNAEGMNIRQCASVEDPVRGEGYRLVSGEIMLYTDPETGEVLREWENPWTGETVEVMHVNNDPVNGRPTYTLQADGMAPPNRIRQQGNWLLMAFEAPLFYENVLGGDYQDYVGGKYHAMEIFDFSMWAPRMLDSEQAAYPQISWVRLSEWLPWMKMRGRHGQLVHNAMGSKIESFDDLPQVMKDEIARNYPIYTAPPPLDDTRKNETTWTVFKKWIAERREDTAKDSGH